MSRTSLPNRIAQMQLLFPLCAALATLLWWFPIQQLNGHYVAGWALCMLTAYVLAETNNSNQLIRVRTRMVACAWLLAMATIGSTHQMRGALLAALCLAISHYALFRTYQLREPVTDAFHALLMVSVGSMLVPPLLVVMPFYLWYLLVFMRVLTPRVLCASLIGMMLPYLFMTVYCIMHEDFQFYTTMWGELTDLVPVAKENYTSLTLQQVMSWGLTSVLGVIGGLHYLFNYYNDKIKVRMLLYVFVFQFVLIEAMVLLQPQWTDRMLTVMAVTAAPLIAHYFSLTPSWWCTLLFLLSVVAVIAQTILTLWMPSMPFSLPGAIGEWLQLLS